MKVFIFYHLLLILGLVLFLFNPVLGQNSLEIDSTAIRQLINQAIQEEDGNKKKELLENTLAQAHQVRYLNGIITSLFLLSEQEKINGNLAFALRYSLEALEKQRTLNEPNQLFTILVAIGNIYAQENLYEEALKYYREAERIWTVSIGNKQALYLDLSLLLGHSFSKLQQPDSALIYYKYRFNHFKNKKSTIGQINALRNIVESYSSNGQYQKALENNLKIKNLLEEDGNNKDFSTIYNNIGYNHTLLKNYEQAIEYFNKALEFADPNDIEQISNFHINIGVAYFNLGDFQKSTDFLLKVREILKKNNQEEKSQINHLIANAFLKRNDFHTALNFNKTAIQKAKKSSSIELLSECYYTAAQIHIKLFEYETALRYYEQHLSISDSLDQIEQMRQQELLQEHVLLERAEKEVKLLLVNQELQDLTINRLKLEKDKLQLESDNLQLESTQKEAQLQLAKQEQEIIQANLDKKNLEARQNLQNLQLVQQRLLAERQERELSDLLQKEKLQKVEIAQKEAKAIQDRQEIDLLRKDQELQIAEAEKQASFRRLAYGVGISLGLILFLILGGLIYARRINNQLSQKNEKIEAQNVEIVEERNKSDQLLLNILPKETAEELKETGQATPKKYESASVLFTDFSGFTSIASSMSPEALIQELNVCFLAFDEIIEKYGLEKIKTIGDAYMCASGIPKSDSQHPIKAIQAAFELVEFMNRRFVEKKGLGKPYWHMRVGIHSGPLVAGVVGSKKFVYDIWGDTVNTASRMESEGAVSKINISGDTYKLIKNHFKCNYRGKIEAKNKGKIDMYFVESVK